MRRLAATIFLLVALFATGCASEMDELRQQQRDSAREIRETQDEMSDNAREFEELREEREEGCIELDRLARRGEGPPDVDSATDTNPECARYLE
jgi:hypothetical protein